MNEAEREHLKFIYDRLIAVHSENENSDYMHRFKQIIDGSDELQVAPTIDDLPIIRCRATYRRDGVYECKHCGLWWDHDDEKPECRALPAMLQHQGL